MPSTLPAAAILYWSRNNNEAYKVSAWKILASTYAPCNTNGVGWAEDDPLPLMSCEYPLLLIRAVVLLPDRHNHGMLGAGSSFFVFIVRCKTCKTAGPGRTDARLVPDHRSSPRRQKSRRRTFRNNTSDGLLWWLTKSKQCARVCVCVCCPALTYIDATDRGKSASRALGSHDREFCTASVICNIHSQISDSDRRHFAIINSFSV